MPHFNLAFLGFGNVGQALAELLLRKSADIENIGITFSVTGIATGSHGLAVNPAGIDLEQILERRKSGLDFAPLHAIHVGAAVPSAHARWRGPARF